jgi:hypothetical protein
VRGRERWKFNHVATRFSCRVKYDTERDNSESSTHTSHTLYLSLKHSQKLSLFLSLSL